MKRDDENHPAGATPTIMFCGAPGTACSEKPKEKHRPSQRDEAPQPTAVVQVISNTISLPGPALPPQAYGTAASARPGASTFSTISDTIITRPHPPAPTKRQDDTCTDSESTTTSINTYTDVGFLVTTNCGSEWYGEPLSDLCHVCGQWCTSAIPPPPSARDAAPLTTIVTSIFLDPPGPAVTVTTVTTETTYERRAVTERDAAPQTGTFSPLFPTTCVLKAYGSPIVDPCTVCGQECVDGTPVRPRDAAPQTTFSPASPTTCVLKAYGSPIVDPCTVCGTECINGTPVRPRDAAPETTIPAVDGPNGAPAGALPTNSAIPAVDGPDGAPPGVTSRTLVA
jgi:hypothetical protein